MSTSKHSHRLALTNEPPSRKRNNHVPWSDALKSTQQVANTSISKRPRNFQHGDGWDGRSSPSESSTANEDSYNMLDGCQPRDSVSFGEFLNLNCVSRSGANCYLNHGWGDYNSVMGLWENELATPAYYEYMPYLFNESIGGKIQDYARENWSNASANSRLSGASLLVGPKMLPDTTMYPIFGNGLVWDFDTQSFQNMQDGLQYSQSDVAEGGTIAYSLAEVKTEPSIAGDSGIWRQESSPPGSLAEQENFEMLEEEIKPTASRTRRQHTGKIEQTDEPWRDRNRIDEAVYGIGKLEDRLKDWNKRQMDAVRETSMHHPW
ncbi:unnamed protein product [Clonostachys solani]|uniref:Uncharacterized protein n=1 Tax=Clonostachys solani TaxID=160281 RepID=A0A9N9YYN4_9HYPO|nr:unnamed protein product [Clonostachys solani]